MHRTLRLSALPLAITAALALHGCGLLGDHGAKHWSDQDHETLTRGVAKATPARFAYAQDCIVDYVEDHWSAEQVSDGQTGIRAKAREAVRACI